MPEHTNQLIYETSPYLLQHAHNPVNWFTWSDVALNKAKEENKPILVSIGYAACHWCHVMEKESFEDEATAAIMNDNFVNIKIDREERPDLDHIYMDAVQAITGSGGWPLNVFLTPEGKPFYGGTYFPPQKAFNRPSWQDVLHGVIQSFNERRHEIDAQAENLTQHLIQSNAFGLRQFKDTDEVFSQEILDETFQNIMKSADKEWGGFGKAPKFPQTSIIQFLLRYYYCNKNEEALQQALLSLDKMIEGGIYDQLGGGFSRYSTDTEWLTPHFEKMLYDNALLVSVLSEAYQLTKEERYKKVINETIQFVRRELLHPEMGFYSALDADSEGVEGKFYVWDMEEVNKIMGSDAALFCEYYNITRKGNWSDGAPWEEEKNILRVKEELEDFATKKNIASDILKELLESGKKRLLEQRSKRIRPLLDDKIILGWNALMNSACCKAFSATGIIAYKQLAIDNMNFLLQNLCTINSNEFYHTCKNSVRKYPAFLDDYAFLIQALINLQEITADTKWLIKAKAITEFVMENFSEAETSFFYYTPFGQQDVIVRKKEVYDGAVPSGNSVMAYNLYQLSILFDDKDWKKRCFDIVSSLGEAITRYPSSFGNWACLLLEIVSGTNEIALVGNGFTKLHTDLLQQYLPHRVLMASVMPDPDFPLLTNKQVIQCPLIWLCKNFSCMPPVASVKEIIDLINKPLSP